MARTKKAHLSDADSPEGYIPPAPSPKVVAHKATAKEPAYDRTKLLAKDEIPEHMRRANPPEIPTVSPGTIDIRESAKAIQLMLDRVHERRMHDTISRAKDPQRKALLAGVRDALAAMTAPKVGETKVEGQEDDSEEGSAGPAQG